MILAEGVKKLVEDFEKCDAQATITYGGVLLRLKALLAQPPRRRRATMKAEQELAERQSLLIVAANEWYDARISDVGAAAKLVKAVEDYREVRDRGCSPPEGSK